KKNFKLYKLDRVPYVDLVEGAKSRLVVGEKVLISFIEMEPNMFFPLHTHESEQVMIVIEGSITEFLGDEKVLLKKGDAVVIGSGLQHGGKVSEEGCKAIDIFVPPREDYINKLKALESSKSPLNFEGTENV
ncbi:MAG: cupin domain-containing protein, partial [Nitrososphaeria archaeon]|nr:cupin domain-containing protein [Nitrososphaeria archaeon]